MEVSRLYYDYIEENINQLIEISKNFVSEINNKIFYILENLKIINFQFVHEDENVGILIYELWSSISDEESTRLKNSKPIYNYCTKALPVLLNIIK